MTAMNIPLMLQEHGRTTITDLDRDIRLTTERLAALCYQRAMVRAHMELTDAFVPLSTAPADSTLKVTSSAKPDDEHG